MKKLLSRTLPLLLCAIMLLTACAKAPKMTYADGNVYEGEWKDGKRHGDGSCTYRAMTYSGAWKDGDWFGIGRVVREDGSEIAGTWSSIGNATEVLYLQNDVTRRGRFVDWQFEEET